MMPQRDLKIRKIQAPKTNSSFTAVNQIKQDEDE